ncbi:MAG TPA: FUSC family protein, partial [Candidatus Saccharimonadia bacterium]|nr:FUSC family protein [Candidatus Saccharimonadia bacterium]
CDALARLPEFAGIRPVIDSALKSLGDTARSAAVTLISHQPGNFALTEVRLRRSQHLLQVLDSQLVEASGGAEREHLRAAIPPLVEVLERLRGTLGETVEKGSSGFTFPAIPPDIQGRSVRSLAAWINPSPAVYSVLIRYSLRMALLTMVAVGCYKVFAIPNGYWIAFTIVVVLQPDYGSTRQRAAERMGGTLAGSLLGSALLWVKMPSALLLACAVGMAFAFAYFLKRRYWFAVFFVTLMLVLITETMGEVHLDFTIVRTLSNLLGGAVALLAAFAFWPASEEKSFHALLAAAIRANASYARAMVALLGTANAAPAEVLMMKRRAENAEGLVAASLQRLLTEPRGHWEDASSLATYNQRITRAFTVMTVHLLHGARQEANETRAAINHVGDILEALASTIEVGWTAAPAANLDAHLKTMDDLLSRARTAASNASPESQLVLAHLTKGAVEIRAMALALHPGGSHEESGDTRMVPASA